MSSIIVVPQDQHVPCNARVLCVLHRSNSVELLMYRSLNDLILLVRVQLTAIVKVNLVKPVRLDQRIGFLHVQRNGQNPGQREVRILDVFTVDLLVHVEQVGILELLNRFLSNLGDPVVHPQPSVFQNHFLQIVELVTLIVISLQILEQLTDMLFCIHYLLWGAHVHALDHDFGDGAFLYC